MARGTRRLLEAEVCQLFRLDADGNGLHAARVRPGRRVPAPPALSAAGCCWPRSRGAEPVRRRRTLWPSSTVGDLLVTPLHRGRERLGLLCAGSPPQRSFGDEDAELARAIAHLAAVAIKRAELIEGLTNANIIKDLFEALAAGATAFAAAKAAEVRCDLSAPYLIVCAEPAGVASRARASGGPRPRRSAAGLAALAPRSAIEAGPGPVRALLPLGRRRPQRRRPAAASVPRARPAKRRRDRRQRAARRAGERSRAYREALDAATIGRALLGDGGAIAYSEVGAYRYLVQIAADEAPRDRMRRPSTS